MGSTVAVRVARGRRSPAQPQEGHPAQAKAARDAGSRRHTRARSGVAPIPASFLACVSHDLRSPLTSVREFVSLVQEGVLGPVNARQEQALGVALRNADAIAEIIEHVLTAHRIQRGAFRLFCRRVRLSELIDERVLVPASRQRVKDVRMRVCVSPSAPDLYADPDRILEALRNLVDNSIRYSGERVDIEIGITAGKEGTVVVAVRDDGWGMEEDALRRIFRRYRRGNGMAGVAPSGLGLGLSIVREIVKLHGGTIRVRSLPGSGTEFLLSLPGYEPKTILETSLRGMWRTRPAHRGGFAYAGLGVAQVRGGAKVWDEVMDVVADVLHGTLGKWDQMTPSQEENRRFSLLLAASRTGLPRRIRKIQEETIERLRFHHGIFLEWAGGPAPIHSTSYGSPESMAAAILALEVNT